MPKDRYRLYHLEKARGGVGLTMIGGSAVVAPDSPPVVRQPAALQGRDRPVAAPADRRRARGRRGGDVPGHPPGPPDQQLHRRLAAAGLPVAAARAGAPQLPEGGRGLGPRPDRRRLRRGRRSAARRPVSTASRCSPTATSSTRFLSPATNQRDDDLGGSLEARLTFPRRVLRAVRAAVGPDFVVGIRMSMDEDGPDGLGRDDALAGAAPLRRRRRRLPQRHQGRRSRATPAWPRSSRRWGRRRRRSSTSPARSAARSDIPVMHAVADLRRRHRAARGPRRPARPGRHDPRPDRRPAPGRQVRRRRRGPDPALRRRQLLPRRDLPVRRRQVHPQPRHRPRADADPRRRARARAPQGAVVVGAGPAGLEAARVLGERGHDVVVLGGGRPCPAARCGSRPRRPGAAT